MQVCVLRGRYDAAQTLWEGMRASVRGVRKGVEEAAFDAREAAVASAKGAAELSEMHTVIARLEQEVVAGDARTQELQAQIAREQAAREEKRKAEEAGGGRGGDGAAGGGKGGKGGGREKRGGGSGVGGLLSGAMSMLGYGQEEKDEEEVVAERELAEARARLSGVQAKRSREEGVVRAEVAELQEQVETRSRLSQRLSLQPKPSPLNPKPSTLNPKP
jgi:hypothetical protein